MKALLAGEEIDFAYESVRLFLLCEGTRWAHLPVDGGWYAQHPRLLDEWQMCIKVKADHERAENAKREREAKNKAPRVR